MSLAYLSRTLGSAAVMFRNSTRGLRISCRCFGESKDEDDLFRKQLLTYTGGSVDLQKFEDTGIAVIQLNNVSKKNALSGKMMSDFADAVEELESWQKGKGLVVYGAGNTFCSGGDISTVKNILNPETGYKMSKFMHRAMNKMHDLPMISVALIQGSALGGGAEIATACDFRLMTETAKVGFVQIKMGVVTGWGGGTRLVKLLGRTNALKALSTGSILDAGDCKRIGLADEILPESDNILELAVEWLKQYCGHPVETVRRTKCIVCIADTEPLLDAFEKERKLFSEVWGGSHQKEALSKNLKHN